MSTRAAIDASPNGPGDPGAIPADTWAFFTARGLSQLGNYLQFAALPLWVLSVTGSPITTGLTFAIEVLPAVFLAPWVGYVVDRYDRRNLLALCETLSALAVGALLIGVSSQVVPLVYAATLLIRVFDAFSMPAVPAMLSSRLPKPVQPRAIATLEALTGAVITIGPILGTLVYGTFGITILLIANLASFVVAAVIVVFLPPCPGSRALGGVRASLREAVGHIAADGQLRPAALAEVVYFLGFGGTTTLAILVAERSIGPGLTGLYVSGLGIGWILGSTTIARRWGHHAGVLLLAGLAGCVVVGLVVWKVLVLGPVTCFLGGVLAGTVNVLVVTAATIVYTDRLPTTAIGRVIAGRRAGINLALALSHMALASLAAALGPASAAMVAGAATAVFGSVLLAPSLVADSRHRRSDAVLTERRR